MKLKNTYQNIIRDLNAEKERLLKIRKQYALLRLGLFITAIMATYQLLILSIPLGIVTLGIFVAAFLLVVKKDGLNETAIKKREDLIRIYQNELHEASVNNLFGNGKAFNDPKHPYAFDLDIFGRFSLFNFLNRTVTAEGSKILANWLKEPSEKPVILERQTSAKELSGKRLFKEEFLRTIFLGNKKELSAGLLNWINTFQISLSNKKILRWMIIILPVISLTLIIGGFFLPLLWTLLILFILINYFLLSSQAKKVFLIHEHINNQSEDFLKYSKLINLISSEPFTETLTSGLKEKLLKHHKAEQELKNLSRLSRILDNRYNALVSIPLNLLTFWEIHTAISVEQWFSRNREHFPIWLNIIGEFDALLSLGILHYNHPDWPFPEIQTNYFNLKAEEIGHPLLPKNQRITNDYDIAGDNRIDIITGSNMGGKSTFLRTLGVNMVLALAGGPVCAKSMIVSPVKIMTYMRIQDSLEENASSFYAELERIRSILKQVEQNEKCFLLLDEVLKGTNSNDRHTGSAALIKQLLQNKVVGLIATHDLQLTEIAQTLPEKIRNFHFDVAIENEELYFDYKLKTGICNSFNASLLMKKIGINIDQI